MSELSSGPAVPGIKVGRGVSQEEQAVGRQQRGLGRRKVPGKEQGREGLTQTPAQELVPKGPVAGGKKQTR